jgi:tape measure domain-containing protein
MATQQFAAALDKAVADLKAKTGEIKAEGEQTGQALDQAFRVLGIKGVKAVEEEIKQLQAALKTVRESADVLPADKAAAVAAFNARLAELRGSASGAAPAVQAVGRETTSAAEAMSAAASKAAAWVAAIAGINSALDVGKKVVETGSEFQNLQVRLENLLGSTQKAADAFDMIKRLAITTPFEVTALTESFVKLTAFGMQPTEAQMRALSDIAANLGGGTETLSRVTLALGQAWTKTKLEGQEILQLAEAGVPVWDALANATGRSVPELQKMSEAGLLGRDVISKLIDELGRMNAGASDKLMRTYAGAVSNAKDALAEFFDMVSRSGVLDFLTAKVQELLAEFDRLKQSGELQAKAKAIADTFVQIATGIESTVKAAVQVGPVLLKIVEVAAALKAVSIASTIYEATAAMVGLRGAATGAAAAMTATAAETRVAAAGMATAATQATVLTTILRTLRMVSGVGLAIGIGELVSEFFRAKSAAEASDRAVANMLAEKPNTGAKRQTEEQKKAAEEAAKAAVMAEGATRDLVKSFDKARESGDSVAEALKKVQQGLDFSSDGRLANSTKALQQLLDQGKITAEQFRDSWKEALKDVDLAEFAVRARTAFDKTSEGAKLAQQAIDAGLRESIRRAGGDFDVISGGMGKAAQQAVQGVDFIIDNLDRLKAQGADVAAALSLSFKKAIDTADGQAALDALRARIEAVRGALGDKLADGLLDQAAQKARELKAAMDGVTPGINSVAEAMKTLGLKSREELTATAKHAQEAYEFIKQAGQQEGESYEAWQARKSEAARRMVAAMVEANNGVVSSEIQARAEAEGVANALDKIGPAGERAGTQAAAGMGKLAQATADANSQLQQQILMTERLRYGRPGENAQPPTGSNKSDYDPGYGSPYSRPGDGPVNGLGETKEQYDRRHRLEGQNAVDNSLIFKLEEKLNAGTLTEADRPLVEAVKAAVAQNVQLERGTSPGLTTPEHEFSMLRQQVLVKRLTDFLDENVSLTPAPAHTTAPTTAPAPVPSPAPAPPPAPTPEPQQTRVATVHQVRIEGLSSSASVINTASEADARAVVEALRSASLRSSR